MQFLKNMFANFLPAAGRREFSLIKNNYFLKELNKLNKLKELYNKSIKLFPVCQVDKYEYT